MSVYINKYHTIKDWFLKYFSLSFEAKEQFQATRYVPDQNSYSSFSWISSSGLSAEIKTLIFISKGFNYF